MPTLKKKKDIQKHSNIKRAFTEQFLEMDDIERKYSDEGCYE